MANIQFWRSNQMSDTSFLDLVKRTFGKTFTKGIDAKNWLIANGYYTSYPDIVTDGLVLYLDAANSSSFKGEPATNLLTSYTENVGTNDTIGFKSNQGTEIKYVPSLGRVTTHYTNIYNDYPNNSASCCPSLYNFGDITILPNTVYTYQIVFRTSTGYYHPNYMYHYELNNGTGLTEYGLLHPSRIKELGNGWIHAWGTFTSQPTANRFICYLFHYEYTTQNKVEVAKISLTQGSTIYEPQFLLDINGTRGTTYATNGGFCDLSGNGNNGEISTSNTYNSEKNGVVKTNSSYITIGNSTTLQFTTGFTQIIGFKLNTSFSDGYKTLFGKPNYTMYGIIVEWYGNNPVLFDFTSDSDGSRNNILLNPDHSDYIIVAHTYDKSLSSNNHVAYVLDKNGLQTGQATVQQNVRITADLTYIGGLDANISFVLEYNRGLTSSEMTQIFNTFRNRFNL